MGTGVTSLKIEGRLKSPEYVAAVTRAYRKALDGELDDTEAELDRLAVIFSRGFCGGHQLCKLSPSDTTPDYAGRTGLDAGEITGRISVKQEKVTTFRCRVSLKKKLSCGDGITFRGEEDCGGIINIIETQCGRQDSADAGETCVITCCGKPPKHSQEFYKTLDFAYNKELNETITTSREFKKVPVSFGLILSGAVVRLTLTDGKNTVFAEASPLSGELPEDFGVRASDIIKQLGTTPYCAASVTVDISGGFATYSLIKQLRREAVERLSRERERRGNI